MAHTNVVIHPDDLTEPERRGFDAIKRLYVLSARGVADHIIGPDNRPVAVLIEQEARDIIAFLAYCGLTFKDAP